MPASYGGAFFHVETGSKESGRRIVLHEWPKKDQGYPEDMGRKTRQFSVRGYCIAYPFDTPELLYQRDYRKARDRLIAALEREGPALLQLPTIPPAYVVNMNYRWAEEQKFGGFCVFDMSFVEYGVPDQTIDNPAGMLAQTANDLRDQMKTVMDNVDEMLRLHAIGAGNIPGPG
jgi:prophage DNA circulation protein